MKLKSRKQNDGLWIKLMITSILGIFLLNLLLFSRSTETQTVASQDAVDFIPHKLELQIPEVNVKKIKTKRDEALQEGLLFSSAEDMVDGTLRVGDDTKAMRLRLKGDLLDHIQGDKWSYRIQLKNDQEWNQMQTFSIHNSGARSHLAEWLMLQLFRQEGIMTPNYDFIEVEENGVSKGVYAYEQFFDNKLLQQNKRPLGPILKHADDAYWENVQKEITPFYWTKMAGIELMNTENKNDPSFIAAFQQAKSKLQAYLDGKAKLIDVFDVDKLAKYYALMEISHAYHAQQITNIRFYYNPLTAKLEPIGFDCYGTDLPNVTKDWSAGGEGQNQYAEPSEDYPYGGVYLHKFFQDSMMTARYLKQLHQYSSEEFLDDMKHKWKIALEQRADFIRSDEAYQDYAFSFDELFKKARWTREKLLPLPSYSLTTQVQAGSRKQLICTSYHYFPIELIGLGNEELVQKFKMPIYLEAYHQDHEADVEVIQNPNNYRRVYFKTLGIDSMFSEEINRLSLAPQTPDILQGDLSFIKEYDCINLVDKDIAFGPCPITLNKTVVIPNGYTIRVKPGTVIRLQSNANFISFSPIQVNGSASEPVRIEGAKNNGILLTQVAGESQFDHVILIDLASVNEAEFQSDAALTIFESEVDIDNVTMTNSTAKSALTIQNSIFNINDLTIDSSPGNGINLEYSKGSIEQLTLIDINVNGIQSYDSSLHLHGATLNHIKGTAVQIDRSDATSLTSIDIEKSYRAFKISDSTIKADEITIQDVEEGIHAKNQDDTSEVVFTRGSMSDVRYPYLLGGDDVVYWNGRKKKAQ